MPLFHCIVFSDGISTRELHDAGHYDRPLFLPSRHYLLHDDDGETLHKLRRTLLADVTLCRVPYYLTSLWITCYASWRHSGSCGRLAHVIVGHVLYSLTSVWVARHSLKETLIKVFNIVLYLYTCTCITKDSWSCLLYL